MLFVFSLLGCLAKEAEEVNSSSIDFDGADEAIAISGSAIQVSWTLAKSSDVTGYRVYSMEQDLSITALAVVSAAESSYAVTGLEPETQYFYIVRAMTNSAEPDENLKFVSAITLEADPLSVTPANVNVATSSIYQIQVSGGKKPYSFNILSGSGIVDVSTGEFVAPALSDVTTVRVIDSQGSSEVIVITIVNQVKIQPTYRQLKIDRTLELSAKSGTPPYTFSIVGGAELVSFDEATNTVTPLGTEGVITIRVTDANGITDDGSVSLVSEYFPKWSLSPGPTTCLALAGMSGSAKCWGSDVHGKLGHARTSGSAPGTMGDNLPFLNFGSDSVIDIAVTAGDSGAPCVVLNDGNVKCWGPTWIQSVPYGSVSGESGVGDGAGDLNGVNAITFGVGRTATKIDGGNAYFCVLMDNSQMKCFGRGYRGALLQGSGSDISSNSQLGDSLPTLNFGTGRSVKDFSVGYESACAILDNDRLKCWGNASSGRLGSGSGSNHLGDAPGEDGDALPYVDLGIGRTVKKVSVGFYHACAILDNDRLKCWGNSSGGRLGNGNASNHLGDAPGEMGDNLDYVDLGTGRTVKDVVAAGYHTCALLDNNLLKCFGTSDRGQVGAQKITNIGDSIAEVGDALPYVDLGAGRTVTKLFPTSDRVSCVELDDFSVRCWGENDDGQLGIESVTDVGGEIGMMGDNMLPTKLGSGLRAVKISSNRSVTCALLDNAKVKCWGTAGYGTNGQDNLLAIGDNPEEVGVDLPDTVLSTTATIEKIDTASYNSCAILSDQTLKCWGRNGYGIMNGVSRGKAGSAAKTMGDNLIPIQLGAGLKVKDFSGVRGAGACAIFTTGQMKCWGQGYSGRLGNESTSHIGGPGGDGSNIPFVNLGSGRTALKVTKGDNHTCVLLDNKKVKCFGNNSQGQLGYGDTVSRGDNPGEMGDALAYVDLGSGVEVEDLFSGASYNCVLTTDKKIKCWGYGYAGHLGYEDSNNRGDNPGEMGDNLPYVDLGTTEEIVKMEMGLDHTCVLFSNEKVKCWGGGGQGRLAQGSSSSIGDQAGEMGSGLSFIDIGLRRVKDLFVGSRNTCFRLENDDLTCFGDNRSGQLRTGHTGDYGDQPNEKADNILIVKKD